MLQKNLFCTVLKNAQQTKTAIAAINVFMNFIVDIIYAFIDPRIRY